MQLPELFQQRMKLLMQEQYDAFLAGYEYPLRRGLRVNTTKISDEKFLEIFPHELKKSPFADHTYYLDAEHKAGSDPLHHAGLYYMQEPSATSAVSVLNPQHGERVLDLCAAPGGKSAAMLAATGGELNLQATDVEEFRLKPLRENLLRAGGKQVQVARHDWTSPCPAEWQGVFDAVLLDVPCSNSGVLQRRVDARWRLNEEEMTRLAALQLSILEQACVAVRPGGRLVYSTCSIDREEDRAVVDAFLATHKEFSLENEYLALPHREQADGAYAALLRRVK